MFRQNVAKKQIIDLQHYITTDCLAADLRGLKKGFTYDKKGNWKRRSSKTQKCSYVVGNKSKSTNCRIIYTKRERPVKCMEASVAKMKQNDYAIVRNDNKQLTRAQNEQ